MKPEDQIIREWAAEACEEVRKIAVERVQSIDPEVTPYAEYRRQHYYAGWCRHIRDIAYVRAGYSLFSGQDSG